MGKQVMRLLPHINNQLFAIRIKILYSLLIGNCVAPVNNNLHRSLEAHTSIHKMLNNRMLVPARKTSWLKAVVSKVKTKQSVAAVHKDPDWFQLSQNLSILFHGI